MEGADGRSERDIGAPAPDHAAAVDPVRDRARGALLGLACGDAVGTTVEFRAPGTFERLTDMVGGGPFRLTPGQWTDDTSMALCLAESIVDTGTLDPSDQMRRFVLWSTEGYLSSNGRCFDIGNTVSQQLRRYRGTGEAVDPAPDPDSAANGSLMRLAPVPIRWHTDLAEAAERSGASSRTTHGAPRPTDACRVLGAMISALINGQTDDEVFEPGFWQCGPLHPEVEALARGSWTGKEPPAIRGTGYCIDALEAAIWAVAGAVDFRDAVLRAANLGDDADTTAAIAGQLAGARWGAAGIPRRWRSLVTLADRIIAMADSLCRAGRAHGVDVGADETWPHDAFVHGWWVEPGSILAGEYPGNANALVAREKVNLLVDAGVRTFVDLTTPDERLKSYAHLVHEAATNRALDLRRYAFGIPDMSVTSTETYDQILRTIASERRRGVVYLHCSGGIGRTGTVVGCLLIDEGLDDDAALVRMAELRAGTRKAERLSPETWAQRAVLRRRSDERGDRSHGRSSGGMPLW